MKRVREIAKNYDLTNPEKFGELPPGTRSIVMEFIMPALSNDELDKVAAGFCVADNVEFNMICSLTKMYQAKTISDMASALKNMFKGYEDELPTVLYQPIQQYSLCFEKFGITSEGGECIRNIYEHLLESGYPGLARKIIKGSSDICGRTQELSQEERSFCHHINN